MSLQVFDKMDVILPNGVTVYHSSKQAMAQLSQVVTKFEFIGHNRSFAKLSEKNWIIIPLKSNWELKVFGKAKVYLLSNKERELID